MAALRGDISFRYLKQFFLVPFVFVKNIKVWEKSMCLKLMPAMVNSDVLLK